MTTASWYRLNSPEICHSPSLLVYPLRVAHNIREMIKTAGSPDALRPHIKTHKMAEVIEMQMSLGIHKFKCATIAEAELLGRCGASDTLLALQPVGRNMERFLDLVHAYPGTRFSTILDDAGIAKKLNNAAATRGIGIGVYMDINVGMDRTGIKPDHNGLQLYKELQTFSHLEVKGFHVYDGHIRNSDIDERTSECDAAFAPVLKLKEELQKNGINVPVIVAGGSPTFPIHARRKGVETSPGTTLLWDERYSSSFPDMNFQVAAVLLCRIISKPGNGLICLDLGHKAIAPEMPFPRLRLLGMENCEQQSQSEEHLVLSCPDVHKYRPGDTCYAIPMHICPTVAKYPSVHTVEKGEITGSWQVAARDHRISI